MKAYQKLGACALTALFMLLPCGCTDPKPTVTFTEYDEAALIGVVTEEEIDAELLARGYSNFFLEYTGAHTKRMLFDAGAVYQAGTAFGGESWRMVESDLEDVYFFLTVSDIPSRREEDASCKVATLNWVWMRDIAVQDHYVSIDWYRDGVAFEADYAMFEIHGEGIPYDSGSRREEHGAFMLKRGTEALTLHFGKQYGCTFSVDPNCAFYKVFSVLQGRPYDDGYFRIQADRFCGSYSIGLVQNVSYSADIRVGGNYTATIGGYTRTGTVLCRFKDEGEEAAP